MGIGFWEWVIIFLIILLLFGARRLPEVARSLGKAFNEFKKAKDELTRAVEEGDAAPPKSDGNGTPPSGDKP
mgnify:CR=1 FL=1